MSDFINKDRLPNHVAIIPDGNRRWARSRGLPMLEGHRRGFEAVNAVTRVARDLGIHTMTFWAFSTENWNREQEEVNYLMKLYEQYLDRNLKEALDKGTRIVHLGRKDRIPAYLRKKIEDAERQSSNNKTHVLNIALDYGGQDEILRAAAKIIQEVKEEKISANDLFNEVGKYNDKYPYYLFKDYLDTGNQPYPYPDLIIRTSGEQRLSGFLSWQMAYSELYFADVHMPDFKEEEFKKALIDFTNRERRFGGNVRK